MLSIDLCVLLTSKQLRFVLSSAWFSDARPSYLGFDLPQDQVSEFLFVPILGLFDSLGWFNLPTSLSGIHLTRAIDVRVSLVESTLLSGALRLWFGHETLFENLFYPCCLPINASVATCIDFNWLRPDGCFTLTNSEWSQ